MTSIASIRKNYLKDVLDEKHLRLDPFQQFAAWMEQALISEVMEPTAMTLGTADLNGGPSLRMVLLKGFDNRGFQFFTHYKSRKAREIDLNPQASLLFFWKELERQIRIEGKIVKLSESDSDAYFQTRPRDSQIGAWISPQSQKISDRKFLEDRWNQKDREFRDQLIPRPPDWGGFMLIPDYFEFWQGRESRLHDRFGYFPGENKTWTVNRLAP